MIKESKETFFLKYFEEIYEKTKHVNFDLFEKSVELICNASERGGKVIIAGNGGSAAMASHVSVDFTKAANIRAINFNEADLLTCFSNDFGYENWVSHALEAYADSVDIVILISSSGSSPNIINGAKKAKIMELPLITFSGFSFDNKLNGLGNINFWCDSKAYNVIEMTHHIWLLAMVDKIIKYNLSTKK
jgi:D-sedoheptulose 7-phosphate isomerase